ncbi:MAG TPA: MucB/RseB C-terminal domain-containing protein [Solimonas sp.]|nr:MucB/RseB C-terminal domain-containing protein [Solimonas sp.]
MRGRALLGVLGLALAPAVFAADPAEFLVRIGEAARGSNYQGVIIYRGDDMLETMRVTHRFRDGMEHERVQSLNGDPREILKENNKVICLLPKDRKLTMNLPTPKALFPALSPERLQQITQVYELRDLGTARVAGRNCQGLAIVPRDQFRYGYEIWADQDSAVPLKVSMIGREGEVLEQMMFTEIEFPATIPDEAFRPQLAPGETRQVVQMVENPPLPQPGVVVRAGLQLDRLPPGYRVAFREMRPLPNGRGTVEHLVLSDGLSAISVFSARKTGAVAPVSQRVSQMGTVHAYRRQVGTLHVTVVGEAPQETVRMIGDGAKPLATAEAPAAP